MNSQNQESKTELDLILTRIIPAPKEKVFEAWTKHLPEWWGPYGMTTEVKEMDLRPGGTFHTIMRFDGQEFDGAGVFLAANDDLIMFTDAFTPGWVPNPEKFFVGVYEFEEVEGGTKLTAKALHWNEEARQKHEEMQFFNGWGQSLERLEIVAKRLAN